MQSNQAIENNDGGSNLIVVRKFKVHSANLIRNIQDLFEQKQICDVTLVSQNDKYKVKAHRAILFAASEYFRTMFTSSFREAHDEIVKLPEVDENTLKLIINFIYTSSIELATDTVEDILKTAHLFKLNGLEVLCCDFLEEQLNPSNCIATASLAEFYNFTKLYDAAEAFVCQNFEKLRKSQEFFDMNVDQLIKFLSSDEIGLQSEEEVFYSIMSWVEHDSEQRKQFIVKLLNCIRFPLLTRDFIEETIESVCNSIDFVQLINKAYKWHLLPQESLFPVKQTLPRHFDKTVIAISGWNSPKDYLSVGYYYSKLDKWFYTQWPALPEKRTCFGSTTFNGKLVIAGGKLPSQSVTNRVDCLDLRTLKWTELPPMGTERHSFGITILNNHIYVVGGIDSMSNALTSVEKWNPLTAQWQYVSSTPKIFENPLASVRFNTLFVSRRSTKPSNLNHAYLKGRHEHNIYEPETSSNISSLETSSATLLGAGTVGTEYFMIVHRNHITKFMKNGQHENISIESVEIGSQYTDCKVSKNCIIVFGENEFLEYLPFRNEWKTMAQLENTEGKVVLILK